MEYPIADPFGPKATTHFDWQNGKLSLSFNDLMRLELLGMVKKIDYSFEEVTSHCKGNNLKIAGVFNTFFHKAVSNQFAINTMDETIFFNTSERSNLDEIYKKTYTIKEIVCERGKLPMPLIILKGWLKCIQHPESKKPAFDHYKDIYIKQPPALQVAKPAPCTPKKPFKISEDSAFKRVQ